MSNSQLQLRVDPDTVYKYANLLDFTSENWCTRDMLDTVDYCRNCPFHDSSWKCLLDYNHNNTLHLTKRILFERYPELAI